ncbi:MAG: hypothetical protein J3Q66DRAFT_347567 [Benniella sp.]|nr:MAG: hypothetical protein J3Q66DRAFT_347567 [Benniella sp.]
MKKPECVGCNKPFARRDTVILHIKNQKRKWDQLCSLLPTLYEAACTSVRNHKGPESSSNSSTNRTAVAKARLNSPWEQSTKDPQSAIGPRKPQKQRRLHVVEKLWHATYQKQMSHLGANRASPTLQSKQGDASPITTATLHDQEARVEGKKEMISATNSSTTSRGENDNSNSPEGGDEAGWLGLAGTSQVDMLKWMMTAMEEPPCWKERKVRMFGAFGILEQKVLESPCHE